jgi:hypothetical protein
MVRIVLRAAICALMVAALSAGCATRSFAQADSALKGVHQVIVTVFEGSDCAAVGIDSSQVVQDATLPLRRMGVGVVSSGPLWLQVAVNCLPLREDQGAKPQAYAYSFQASLHEWVWVQRDTSRAPTRLTAVTWSRAGTGWCGTSLLAENIDHAVAGLLDRFENDWLAANPRSGHAP